MSTNKHKWIESELAGYDYKGCKECTQKMLHAGSINDVRIFKPRRPYLPISSSHSLSFASLPLLHSFLNMIFSRNLLILNGGFSLVRTSMDSFASCSSSLFPSQIGWLIAFVGLCASSRTTMDHSWWITVYNVALILFIGYVIGKTAHKTFGPLVGRQVLLRTLRSFSCFIRFYH